MSADELTLPGWTHVYSGKVRDLYVPSGRDLATAERVLVVASDRVSAFDHVLEPGIPGKGELLTTLSLWWFDQLDGARTTCVDRDEPAPSSIPAAVAGRAMLVQHARHVPDRVRRARLPRRQRLDRSTRQTQSVCGIAAARRPQNGDRLPEPIYTPACKAPLGEHDENISFERTVELVGAEVAATLRCADASLRSSPAHPPSPRARGVILADTKFEFGADRQTGVITLADEVLTSDSQPLLGRRRSTRRGNRTESFDKQIVRDWLAANWDQATGGIRRPRFRPRSSSRPPPATAS